MLIFVVKLYTMFIINSVKLIIDFSRKGLIKQNDFFVV